MAVPPRGTRGTKGFFHTMCEVFARFAPIGKFYNFASGLSLRGNAQIMQIATMKPSVADGSTLAA